jgi:ABC-type bacteriocin/lantibiotic exporter with double-glycine peptidase domain
LLLIVSPITFFLAFVIFIFFLIIFNISTKKLLNFWGLKRQKYQTAAIKYVQEGIKNIKDLKVYGVEENFFNYFDSQLSKKMKIEKYVTLLSSTPKYLLEFISVVIFIFIYWTLYVFDFSNQKIIIIVSIFAVAAIKLLPSISRILNALIQIKYSAATIETILKEVNLKNNYKNNKLLLKKNIIIKNNLVIKDLYFNYKNSHNYLFRNINIKIPFKKMIAIVGESGVGKTTFVDIILGLIKPIKGSVLVNNQNILSNLKSWRNYISYVQQTSYFTQDSIKNNIAIISKEDFIDVNKINYCLKQVGLSKFVSNLPKKINTRLSELANNLSGGQKQRLSIARALYRNPEILILDEATNSLDEKSEIELIKNIKCLFKSKTVFIITHKRALIKYCDSIIYINNKAKIKIKNT